MLVYSIVLFFTAALFALVGAAIYKGRTDLIHSYHREKVADQAAYGKAFGKALFVLAAALFISGIIGLLGDSGLVAWIAVAVLMVGIGFGIGCIVAVQKKYNKGIF